MHIKIDKEVNVWVTSDTHYSHKNICRGVTDWRLPNGEIPVEQTRAFNSLEEMNETIVNNINSVVGQEDVLIHLGDWSFGGFDNIKKFKDRIICQNIYLILGNHDHHIENNRDGCKGYFTQVSHYGRLKYGDNNFVLMHYPISSWDGLNKGVIHLHGHTHLLTQRRFGVGKRMDIGMDGHSEFRPYNLTREIIPLMDKRPIKSEMGDDHHIDEIIGKDNKF